MNAIRTNAPRWAPARRRPMMGAPVLPATAITGPWPELIVTAGVGVGVLHYSLSAKGLKKQAAYYGGLALLGLAIFRFIANSPWGIGGSPGTSSGTSAPLIPTRPLEVTIQDWTYLVNGREVSLEHVVELAQGVPPGSGPAVDITCKASSRASAEVELQRALEAKGVSFRLDYRFCMLREA